MSGFWRVSAVSTAAAKVEKILVPTATGREQKKVRLLGYSACQYAVTTAAGVNIVLGESDLSSVATASTVVGVIGTATEMVPVTSYSSAGLAVGRYVALSFSASVALSTQCISMWGDYV